MKKFKASTSKRQQKFNVNLLKSENTKRESSLELRNRFEALTDMDSEDVERHWEKLKVSYIETCQTVLGTKKRDHKEWISQICPDKEKRSINHHGRAEIIGVLFSAIIFE